MKHISALVLALSATAFSVPAFAAQPLLSPAELQAKLSDTNVRVIDIRDPKSYAANHIPGAVSAPYGAWRGPASNPGELPALPKLTTLVQSLGLTPSTHAVIVSSGADATDFGASARVYWTLKVLGLKELSVLNGGLKGWTTAGLPQNNQAVKVAASSFQPQIDYPVLQSFLDLNTEYYNSEVIPVDFKDSGVIPQVNAWVENNTDGLIKETLKELPPGVVMLLINAIYFKGAWKTEFDPENTHAADFYTPNDTITVDMMHIPENDFPYFANDLFQAIDLPYGDSIFSMSVFLPPKAIANAPVLVSVPFMNAPKQLVITMPSAPSIRTGLWLPSLI